MSVQYVFIYNHIIYTDIIKAKNYKETLNYKGLQNLLVLKEDEKVAQGGQKAEDGDLQINTLKKYYTALNHLEDHPQAFKFLQEEFLKCEVPFQWKPFHFSSYFWSQSDEIVTKV